jgi:hypothetical protein
MPKRRKIITGRQIPASANPTTRNQSCNAGETVSIVIVAIILRRDVCGCVERATYALHGTRIDAISFGYLPHALSAGHECW